ncbi:MAG: 4-alpha-glucanotransferase [Chloroflexota bacterium]
MRFERASGVLLHPTSLSGPYGIGDIGPEAYRWVDFLTSAGCGLWQVLPLGPTGYGDSPYQCFSAFAGNPFIVSPEALIAENLLHGDDIIEHINFSAGRVDFGAVIPYKLGILDQAYNQFQRHASPEIREAFETFKSTEAHWLEDFALFMAIKDSFGGGSWVAWPAPLRQRKPKALHQFRTDNATAIERHAFRQFLFFRQWGQLRAYAHEQGIQIIGDIPIFVAHDSADVWAHPELFYLDADGNPTVVAGVPPDYFSPTGQLWGNPLYRWDVQAAEGYRWWLARLRAVLSTVDIVRLDHFRGFAGYWEVPGDAETAIAGQWVPGPGKDFFRKVEASLGSLPIIAEDLGVITDDVVELRETFGLPGMKIMVFAFDGDASNPFLPHNYTADYAVYTGTHDNDTSLGWYQRVDEKERDFARRYLARDGSDISWDLIRAAWASVAVFALAPMQDLLSLDNHARMNYPSKLGGNWVWRMPPEAMSEHLRSRLAEMNFVFRRG